MLVDAKIEVEPTVSVETQMKVLGFSSTSTEALLRGHELTDDIAPILKTFAKLVVQGKDRNFDSSEVIIVCGPERSGKTTLAKKLGQFLPSLDENSPNRVISDASFSDLETCLQSDVSANIASLFRKRLDTSLGGGRIIFDYDGSMDTLGSFLLRLSKLKQQPKFSLVYSLEVGKSYNAVKELIKLYDLPNLFIALTKMDTLEVSISELSAIFDIKQKIQFFSGLKIVEGGLDFAKVSVMESFLTNLSGQEGW
jgi:energy-coupling factor transporter ATP-binding protein EcfA2